MAWSDDYDVPASWGYDEHTLFDRLTGGDAAIAGDSYLQSLFDAAFYHYENSPTESIHGHGGDERNFIINELTDYLFDEYGIDFDDSFDWEGWRSWYDGQ